MLAIWHIVVLFSLIFFICACILRQTLIGGAITYRKFFKEAALFPKKPLTFVKFWVILLYCIIMDVYIFQRILFADKG